MNLKYQIKIGDKFGNIEIIKILKHPKIEIACICGHTKIVDKYSVINNDKANCGCVGKQKLIQRNTTHNLCRTRLHRIWVNIKKRCFNQNCKEYKYYGAKGITICEEWKDNFLSFYNWAINNGYTDNLTIERKNYKDNYTPENCKWIPGEDQSKNKSNNVIITAFGETKLQSEWLKDPRCVIGQITIIKRIKQGIHPEIALTKKRLYEDNTIKMV